MRYLTMISSAGLLFASMAAAGNRHHVIIDGGQVKLRGAITAPGCSVSTASRNQIVDMGIVRSNQFSGVGSYSPPVAFTLHLTGCTQAIYHTVGISFWGVTDGKDPQVLKTGDGPGISAGVGLALFNAQDELLIPNTLPAHRQLIQVAETRLRFLARYRATSRQVTGGDASSMALFMLTYQ